MTYSKYSQAVPTPLGNMSFVGDLYRVRRPFNVLLSEIRTHLTHCFPAVTLKLRGSNKFGRRRIAVGILDVDASSMTDLTHHLDRNALIASISDQVWRYGCDRSNPTTGFHSRTFNVEIDVDDSFWAKRQRRHGSDLVEDKVKLSAFKKALRPGHILETLKSPESCGARHKVITVNSRIVVDDGVTSTGRFHWEFPIAAAFLCDGSLVRISKGNSSNPDAYTLLNWIQPDRRQNRDIP